MSRKLLAKQFLSRVIKYLQKQSDPSIAKKIVADLRLGSAEIRDVDFKEFLAKFTKEPIDLDGLINAMQKGLLSNTLFCDLLAFIERNQLISDEELQAMSKQLQIQLNLLCLFEAFAVTMVNSFTFNEDVYCFTKKQRNTAYPGNPLFNFFFGSNSNNFSLFKNLKLISVDPVIAAGAFLRSLGSEQLDKAEIEAKSKEFIKKYGLALWNAQICPPPLGEMSDDSVKNVSLNILEATWEEQQKESGAPGDNAYAGAALIRMLEHLRPLHAYIFQNLVLPDDSSITASGRYSLLPDLTVNQSRKRVSQFYVSKEWMYLYNSWNLFFVVQNLDSKFLPIKLLIPSVLNALPSQYMETRVFVLYLIGNLFHYNKLSVFTEDIKLSQAQVILNKWGEINKKYADALLKTSCADLEETSEMVYHDIFGEHTHFSLAYHVANFIRDFEHFRITSDPETRTLQLA
ncbi:MULTISPECIES: hypothetical protein [Legionella]|uniref:hypothetical protein n=1 Tax=Legionella TaxID=445 RepID=UPI00095ACEE0|nr:MULTISPECIES: hypothetical protein [Legionella]MBN9227011.1 hypothetical protein [Legionella steelei]OJW14112.1 MAG: hypothetical protein BGO44_09190 [Legionella sp. 39-23]